jgi:hypothetical protein
LDSTGDETIAGFTDRVKRDEILNGGSGPLI